MNTETLYQTLYEIVGNYEGRIVNLDELDKLLEVGSIDACLEGTLLDNSCFTIDEKYLVAIEQYANCWSSNIKLCGMSKSDYWACVEIMNDLYDLTWREE